MASDQGSRSANEDCAYVNLRLGIFLVADGIGGCFGGAVASQLLVDTIPSLLAATLQGRSGSNDDLQELIRRAVCAAHEAMREMAVSDSRLMKMGSTISMGLIEGETLHIAHVGDSRVYVARQGSIRQITKDQTMVQALVDAGVLTREEAKSHRLRHVILDSVSADHIPNVEIVSHQLMPGDRILFATDGLTDVVDEEHLCWPLTHIGDPQFAANLLVSEALGNNARDNITCVVVHYRRRRKLARTQEPPFEFGSAGL